MPRRALRLRVDVAGELRYRHNGRLAAMARCTGRRHASAADSVPSSQCRHRSSGRLGTAPMATLAASCDRTVADDDDDEHDHDEF